MKVRSSLCLKILFDWFFSLSESLLRPWGLRGRERCRRRPCSPLTKSLWGDHEGEVLMDTVNGVPREGGVTAEPLFAGFKLIASKSNRQAWGGTEMFRHGTHWMTPTGQAGQLIDWLMSQTSIVSISQTVWAIPGNTREKSGRTVSTKKTEKQ